MSDAWAAVGGIAAAVAAGAAAVALIYARRTVRIAKETLDATTAANAAAAKERAEEAAARAADTAERRQVLAEEKQRQQLAQLERVAELLGRLADLVQEGEWGSEAARRRGILVPVVQKQLKTALDVLAALGRPDMPYSADAVSMPTDQMHYVDAALAEVADRARAV